MGNKKIGNQASRTAEEHIRQNTVHIEYHIKYFFLHNSYKFI